MMLQTQTTWAQTAMAHQAVRGRSPESDWFIPEEGRGKHVSEGITIRVGWVVIGILLYCLLRESLAFRQDESEVVQSVKTVFTFQSSIVSISFLLLFAEHFWCCLFLCES